MQVSGPAATFDDATRLSPSVTLPRIRVASTLTFSLFVDDGALTGAPASVSLSAAGVNGKPVANAGADQKVAPSAKLPVSWRSDAAAPDGDFNSGAPSPLGDQPKFFDQLPGTNFGQGSGYNPLYPFGFGLSYTTFQVSGLSATSSVSANGTVTASFTVANTGSRAGTDIVPVYVHQPVSAIVVPNQRLVGFTRVTLDPGQSKTVRVSFPVSQLAVTPGDIEASGSPRVVLGSYQVQVGSMSADFTING